MPQWSPDQIRAIQNYERKAASPSTAGTWIVAALMVVAVIVWITLVVTRSHHTSVTPPNSFMRTAAPR